MQNEDDQAASAVPERRAMLRRGAVERRARIAWRGAGWPMRVLPAQLIDISKHGARVSTRVQPPSDKSIWIGLESLAGEWVRASVRSLRTEEGRWVVHLSFSEPGPAGLLERAAPEDDEGSFAVSEPRLFIRLDFEWLGPR